MPRSIATVVLASLLLVPGCRDKASPPPPVPVRAADAGAVAVTPPDAAPPATPPTLDSHQALWTAYQAAHVGATTANVQDHGRAIWALLSEEARAMVSQATEATLGAMDAGIAISSEQLAYKLLGESAAARRDFMATATITESQAVPPRQIGGVEVHVQRLVATGPGGPTVELFAERRGSGPWLLAAASALLVTEDAVFRAPAGSEAPAGTASLDALAARWVAVLGTGTGWDAYNLLSPEMRTKMLEMMANVGGSGAADVARIFEKTMVDRRDAGITITGTEVLDRTADRGTIVLSYSEGNPDRFTGVRVDGVWWLEMSM